MELHQPDLGVADEFNALTNYLVPPSDPAMQRYLQRVQPNSYVPDELVLMQPHNGQPYYSCIPMLPDTNESNERMVGMFPANGACHVGQDAPIMGVDTKSANSGEDTLMTEITPETSPIGGHLETDPRPKGGGKAPKSAKRGKSRTASSSRQSSANSNSDEKGAPPRSEKQRLASKTYRQRRKQYVEGLEAELMQLKLENARLKAGAADDSERTILIHKLARENSILLAALRECRARMGLPDPQSIESVEKELVPVNGKTETISVATSALKMANAACNYCGEFNISTLARLDLSSEQLSTVATLRESFCNRLNQLRATRDAVNTTLRTQLEVAVPSYNRLKEQQMDLSQDATIRDLKKNIDFIRQSMADEAALIDETVDQFHSFLGEEQRATWRALIAPRRHSRFLVLTSLWSIKNDMNSGSCSIGGGGGAAAPGVGSGPGGVGTSASASGAGGEVAGACPISFPAGSS